VCQERRCKALFFIPKKEELRVNYKGPFQVRMSDQLRDRLEAEARKRGVKAPELTRALLLGFFESQDKREEVQAK
jgi:hypothetical protein